MKQSKSNASTKRLLRELAVTETIVRKLRHGGALLAIYTSLR